MSSDSISGRQRERERLAATLASREAEFLAIYGRRRVGKTFLIREYFGPRASLFQVTGRFNGSLHDHLRIFAEAVSRTFGEEVAIPASWHDAFGLLREKLSRRRRKSRKTVLFFDELPWLATRRSGCLEELEFFWNDWACSQRDLVLVVCGSAASWMLRRVIHARGGLHNRVTRAIRLLPFDLDDSRSYLQARRVRYTERQIAELYMAVGGVPYYLSLVERGLSAAQAIDQLLFDRDAPLRSEFDRLFASLFGEGTEHEAMVKAIAKRRQGLSRSELLEAVGLRSGGGANRLIDALEESGFVLTTIPYGRQSRDRFHRLVDELSLFHLHWLADRRRVAGESWTKLRGKPAWRAWAGLAFESLCLKHVDAIKNRLGISGVETSHTGWQHRSEDGGPGAQIDLLIDRADDVISVCEMKYSDEPFVVTKAYAQALEQKLAVFRAVTGTSKAIQLVLVSARGLKRNRWSEDLIDATVELPDLFYSRMM